MAGYSTGDMFKNQDISFFWYIFHVGPGYGGTGLFCLVGRVKPGHGGCLTLLGAGASLKNTVISEESV